ncbi:hypothetical protein QQS21_003782 [Conoideocrella luteorostrata]|uniref:LYC1 C-terminal domain-containing protein n=1 Tax=Conoideocrella luteorostrata TaxID=1105319 RepID=A0AAJ0CTM1_9HYPO|nr:hypothetical protein QQS21_003782 [Conoideocrella luteorostrata]
MDLPNKSSSPFTIAKATPDESVYTWTRHQPFWGPQHTQQSYITRESKLLTYRLTKNGGLTTWILTDTNNNHDGETNTTTNRTIFSSLETYRKRAIVRGTDGLVRDVIAYGVASVFTPEEHRRQGYAAKMLSLLGETLSAWQSGEAGSAEFSVLFSDIGRNFYAQQQWMPFPSTHLSFATKPFRTDLDNRLTLITDDNLQTVAELDEQTMRKKIATPPIGPHKVRVAILPDFATYEWHLARARCLTSHLLGRTPTVHGAIYTPPGLPNSRIWMLWSCDVYGGKDKLEENVMHILHFALEDDKISNEELTKAFRSIMGVVHNNAHEWFCPKINMWNPDDRTKTLVNNLVDLQADFIVRQKSNITSLRWFGEGPVSEVEWVDNQRFEWC